MSKKITILAVIYFALLSQSLLIASPIKIQPLSEAEVKSVISRLNKQGVVVGFDKEAKKDEVFWYDNEHSSFGIADTGAGWYLYKVYINNDKEDEYVLGSIQGSGGFFGIEAIYKDNSGKFSDIFNQIKLPMRRLIRDSEKATYDLDKGYSGFMNGGIDIENIDGKIYFTLRQVERDYGIDDYEKSFQPPEFWKLLWDKNELKLITCQTNPSSER